MKPKHQRLVFVAVSMVFLCAAALFTLRAFRENLVFFYSPSELAQHMPAPTQLVRLGGLVKTGSIAHDGDQVRFIVTDGAGELSVHYTGLLPSLFREGQGVIAEGHAQPGGFEATKILAKHDETYMPKEVVDALKRSGNWHGQ